MKTIRDFFGGGDLLHLALLLSLLRVDLQPRWQSRFDIENGYQRGHGLNPLSQKVMDDLADLGRFSAQSYDRLEITAYVVNAVTGDPESENETEDHSDLFEELFGRPLPDGRSDDVDSGVSDVGQLSDSETGPPSSPLSPRADPLDPLDWLTRDIVFPQLGSPSDHFGGLDWNEIESVAQLQSADPQQPIASDPAPFSDDDHGIPMDLDLDLDFLDDLKTFQPDEEDVAHQLIDIDNRLTDLDGTLENLNDGVELLGEQLASAQTERDAESFFLRSLDAEESVDDLVFGAVGPAVDSDFANVNDWEIDMDRTLREIFGNHVDMLAVEEIQVKVEPEYFDDDFQEDSSNEMKEEMKINDEDTEGQSEIEFTRDEDSESEFGAAWTEHLEDHNYAKMPLFKSLRSSLESVGAVSRSFASPSSSPASSSSYPSNSESFNLRRSSESRDELKARQLRIPFLTHDLINSPMEEFNAMMLQGNLTKEQITLCRDIRRRGKNKVAAQNSRMRKIGMIISLEDEVSKARHYKTQLMAERKQLYKMRRKWTDKLRHIEEAVLRGLNMDVEKYSLEYPQDSRGEVKVVQRHSTRAA